MCICLQFQFVTLVCVISVQCKGNVLSAKTGIIQSPEYPNLYPPFADCEWNVAVERGYSIVLDFEDVSHVKLSLCNSIGVKSWLASKGITIEGFLPILLREFVRKAPRSVFWW